MLPYNIHQKTKPFGGLYRHHIFWPFIAYGFYFLTLLTLLTLLLIPSINGHNLTKLNSDGSAVCMPARMQLSSKFSQEMGWSALFLAKSDCKTQILRCAKVYIFYITYWKYFDQVAEYYTPKNQHSTCKWMVGILVSFWDGLFFRCYISFRECNSGVVLQVPPFCESNLLNKASDRGKSWVDLFSMLNL